MTTNAQEIYRFQTGGPGLSDENVRRYQLSDPGEREVASDGSAMSRPPGSMPTPSSEGASPLVARIRTSVRDRLGDGPPTLTQLAREMHTSERTLRRRLSEQGINFRELVDEIRRDEANRLLADGNTSIADIAQRVGYGEVSAFSRSFRRWTGQSPRSYRRQQRQPSPDGDGQVV